MKSLIAILVGVVCLEAGANNYFIPNHYRSRRAANVFSAVGWSDRKEATAVLKHNKDLTKRASIKREEDTSNSLEAATFYRVSPQWNIEGLVTYLASKEKEFNPSADGDQNTGKTFGLGVGYAFPEAPAVIAANIFHSRFDAKDGATDVRSHSWISSYNLGVGWKLPSDIYLGGGISAGWSRLGGIKHGPTWGYYLGGGKVFGDAKNPVATVETYLLFANVNNTQVYRLGARGLWNMEAFQFIGSLGYGTDQGADKGSSAEIAFGVDYELQAFYINPLIALEVEKDEDGIPDNDTETVLSLELGYRQKPYEAFVRYNYGKDKIDYEAPISDVESNESEVTVGGTYFF